MVFSRRIRRHSCRRWARTTIAGVRHSALRDTLVAAVTGGRNHRSGLGARLEPAQQLLRVTERTIAHAGGAVGAAGAATGTAGAGGSGTAVESPPGFFTAGYLTRTPWMGYVFTIVDTLGSVVSPMCDTVGCMPAWGTQACAKGTVAKNANSSGFAGLAFHANDPMAGPRGTWTSTGAGVYVSVAVKRCP